MSVRDQLVQLSELGLLDQKLKELREKQKALPQKADEAKKRAEEISLKEKSLEAKIADITLKRRQLDADLQNEKSNLRKWESRAEKIKGEREYTALMSEIGSQKRAISNVESKILEAMGVQEGLDKESAELKKAATLAQKIQEEEWAAVKEEVDALEEKITQILQSRATTSQKVPAVLFKRYEQIASRRAGIGLALVKREVCQACSRMIPAELFARVAKGEIIEQCPSCQRILITEEMSFAQGPTP